MRTCDPFVNSPGEKWFVFSDPSDCRRTQRIRKALLRSAKLMPVRSESAVCSFAYFCCCNGKCVARCCSCRQGCAVRFVELYHQVHFPQALTLLREWRGRTPLPDGFSSPKLMTPTASSSKAAMRASSSLCWRSLNHEVPGHSPDFF
jgi:hypothetical protein